MPIPRKYLLGKEEVWAMHYDGTPECAAAIKEWSGIGAHTEADGWIWPGNYAVRGAQGGFYTCAGIFFKKQFRQAK